MATCPSDQAEHLSHTCNSLLPVTCHLSLLVSLTAPFLCGTLSLLTGVPNGCSAGCFLHPPFLPFCFLPHAARLIWRDRFLQHFSDQKPFLIQGVGTFLRLLIPESPHPIVPSVLLQEGSQRATLSHSFAIFNLCCFEGWKVEFYRCYFTWKLVQVIISSYTYQ